MLRFLFLPCTLALLLVLLPLLRALLFINFNNLALTVVHEERKTTFERERWGKGEREKKAFSSCWRQIHNLKPSENENNNNNNLRNWEKFLVSSSCYFHFYGTQDVRSLEEVLVFCLDDLDFLSFEKNCELIVSMWCVSEYELSV